jgi:DNA-binding transcriptional MerR regulator
MVYLQVDMKASQDDTVSWSVGELAALVGVAPHVLRHWEDEGLLCPSRSAAGYRRYGRADLVRVLTIQSSKVAGMSLDQIRALLDVGAEGRASVLEAHLVALSDQSRELERSRLMTEHALRCRAHDVAQCPRFASYVEDLVVGLARDPAVDGIPGWAAGVARPPEPAG